MQRLVILMSEVKRWKSGTGKISSWICAWTEADQTDIYEIRSNRESGFGRYDVMMVPKEREKTKIPAIILEFKVKNNKKEQTLEENSTVITSADQRKKYDAELLARGIPKEKIRHYGFALKEKMC